MSQTDRQTDKATHWNSAVFDSGLDKDGKPWSGQWERLEKLPPFVKEVHKQKEICPETKREHYQTHVVCQRQVRLSQLREWLPHTNWKAVIGKQYIENSIKYTSKSDTAVAGTHEVQQGEKYFRLHELLQVIARYAEPELEARDYLDFNPDGINGWKWITRRLISIDPVWVEKLANPALRRMWADWGSLFIRNWEDSGAFIIEGPAPEREEDFEEYSFCE